jgi:hypothetical protein
MKTRRQTSSGRAGRRAGRATASEREQRIGAVSAAASQIVLDAAALLDEEVAAGVVAARRVQERFQKEQRIDPADFGDALKRFQRDAHSLVDALNDRFTELRSPKQDELVGRFVKNAHDLLDLAAGMITTGAEIANQLAQANLKRQAGRWSRGSTGHRRRR